MHTPLRLCYDWLTISDAGEIYENYIKRNVLHKNSQRKNTAERDYKYGI